MKKKTWTDPTIVDTCTDQFTAFVMADVITWKNKANSYIITKNLYMKANLLFLNFTMDMIEEIVTT